MALVHKKADRGVFSHVVLSLCVSALHLLMSTDVPSMRPVEEETHAQDAQAFLVFYQGIIILGLARAQRGGGLNPFLLFTHGCKVHFSP